MTLADIYDIVRNVRLYDKDRILVASDVQALSLSYRVELGSVVPLQRGILPVLRLLPDGFQG